MGNEQSLASTGLSPRNVPAEQSVGPWFEWLGLVEEQPLQRLSKSSSKHHPRQADNLPLLPRDVPAIGPRTLPLGATGAKCADALRRSHSAPSFRDISLDQPVARAYVDELAIAQPQHQSPRRRDAELHEVWLSTLHNFAGRDCKRRRSNKRRASCTFEETRGLAGFRGGESSDEEIVAGLRRLASMVEAEAVRAVEKGTRPPRRPRGSHGADHQARLGPRRGRPRICNRVCDAHRHRAAADVSPECRSSTSAEIRLFRQEASATAPRLPDSVQVAGLDTTYVDELEFVVDLPNSSVSSALEEPGNKAIAEVSDAVGSSESPPSSRSHTNETMGAHVAAVDARAGISTGTMSAVKASIEPSTKHEADSAPCADACPFLDAREEDSCGSNARGDGEAKVRSVASIAGCNLKQSPRWNRLSLQGLPWKRLSRSQSETAMAAMSAAAAG